MWGSTYPTSLKRLVTLQRSVVRIVNKDAFNTHTDLKLLKVDQIVLLQVVSFVFFFPNNLLLPFFDSYSPVVRQIFLTLTPTSVIPGPPFRIVFQFLKLILKKFSIFYQGPKVYNSMNIEIRNTCSFFIFKSEIKLI